MTYYERLGLGCELASWFNKRKAFRNFRLCLWAAARDLDVNISDLARECNRHRKVVIERRAWAEAREQLDLL